MATNKTLYLAGPRRQETLAESAAKMGASKKDTVVFQSPSGKKQNVSMDTLDIPAFLTPGKKTIQTPELDRAVGNDKGDDVTLLGRVGRAAGAGLMDSGAGFLEAGGKAAELFGLAGGRDAYKKSPFDKLFYENADKLREKSEDVREKAYEGVDTLAGQLALDAVGGVTQLAGDAAVGYFTGGGIVPLLVRSFGSGAYEAEQEGATLGQSIAYGAGTAGLEAAIEKLTGGLSKIYGKGPTDDIVKNLVQRMTGNEPLQRAMTFFINAAGEGGEEALTTALDPFVKAIYDEGETAKESYGTGEGRKELRKEALYSAAVGAVIGAAGNIATGGLKRPTQSNPLADTILAMEAERAQQSNPLADTLMGEDSTSVNTDPAQAPQEAIDAKKEVPTPAPGAADATQLRSAAGPQMYVQDVRGGTSDSNIPQNEPVVNEAPAQQSNPMADALLGEEQQPTGPFHPINEQAQQETQAERGRGPVNVPVEDISGQLTPKTSSTLANAKITPNDFAASLQKDVAEGKFSRIPFSDADAVAGAEKTITDFGWNEAMKQYESAVRNGQSSKSNTALGVTLYNHAVNAGTPEGTMAAMNVASLLIENAKTTAQALQAVSIINKLYPEGRLYMVVKSVENMQQGLSAKFGQKAPNLEIDSTMLEAYRDALVKGDEAAAKEAMTNITKDIASQMPATWKEKLQAWRYLAMLGNFRTQVRNIAGNAGFVPFRVVKNALATVGEQFLPEGMERTKAVLNRNSAADRALLQIAGMDFTNVEDAIQSGGKYQESLQSDVDKERTIFNNRLLEAYRKAVGTAMEKGDTLFSKPIYSSALAMYLKANGFTAADFTNGKMSEEQIARAREVAIQEAARATYRDASWLSEGLNKLTSGVRRAAQSNDKGSGVAKVGNLFVEGVLPFKKTPANVLARAIDYSPAGIIKGVVQMHNDVKAGKSAAEAIDSLAAGLTGTGVMLLGAFLRSQGILSGSEDEDDKQAGFDSLQGRQNYALTIGDKNFTIDWLAPGAVSLFVGAEIMDAMQDKGLTLRETIDSLLDIADPIVEMSMLSGVQDMLETGKYGDAGLMAYVSTAATSYLSQYIPTLFGQIERSIETGREETYRYNDEHSGVLGPTGQRFVGNIMNKLPGEYNQVDYIDAWGRTQDYGKGNLFNQFLNPSYVSTDRSTAVDDELQRLYDAGQTAVFPQRFAQSDQVTTYDADGESTGKRYLTAEEYEQFNRTMGETRLEMAEKLIQSSAYKAMGNEARAKAISLVYEYGKAVATKEVEASYKLDGWMQKAMDSDDPARYIQMYAATKALTPPEGSDSVKKYQELGVMAKQSRNDAEADGWIKGQFTELQGKKYDIAREYGFSPERFVEFYEAQSVCDNNKQKVIDYLTNKKGWPADQANNIAKLCSLWGSKEETVNNWRW